MAIDKEEKAKHREDIEEFWLWMLAMAPVVPMVSLGDVLDSKLRVEAMSADVALQAVKDYNDPARIDLLKHFLLQSARGNHGICWRNEAHKWDRRPGGELPFPPWRIRALFHRWINKRLGFDKPNKS